MSTEKKKWNLSWECLNNQHNSLEVQDCKFPDKWKMWLDHLVDRSTTSEQDDGVGNSNFGKRYTHFFLFYQWDWKTNENKSEYMCLKDECKAGQSSRPILEYIKKSDQENEYVSHNLKHLYLGSLDEIVLL